MIQIGSSDRAEEATVSHLHEAIKLISAQNLLAFGTRVENRLTLISRSRLSRGVRHAVMATFHAFLIHLRTNNNGREMKKKTSVNRSYHMQMYIASGYFFDAGFKNTHVLSVLA